MACHSDAPTGTVPFVFFAAVADGLAPGQKVRAFVWQEPPHVDTVPGGGEVAPGAGDKLQNFLQTYVTGSAVVNINAGQIVLQGEQET